jgi:SAM-dependent methyltransferase
MRELDRIFAPESFDAVVSLWNAWGYFDRRSDDRRTLAGISRVLKPSGSLVINTLNEGGVLHRLQSTTRAWHEEKGGRYFLRDFQYVRSTRKMNARWVLVDPQKRSVKRYSFSQNVYSTPAFRKELRRVGLRMTRLWGTLEGQPYSKTSWHQTFVACKGRKTPQ